MAQYKLYNDGDGHEYLIPYGIWSLFLAKLERLGDDEDEVANYLDNFQTLEGREYVIFLEEDLEKQYK